MQPPWRWPVRTRDGATPNSLMALPDFSAEDHTRGNKQTRVRSNAAVRPPWQARPSGTRRGDACRRLSKRARCYARRRLLGARAVSTAWVITPRAPHSGPGRTRVGRSPATHSPDLRGCQQKLAGLSHSITAQAANCCTAGSGLLDPNVPAVHAALRTPRTDTRTMALLAIPSQHPLGPDLSTCPQGR